MRDDRIVQKMEAKRLVLSDPLAKHLPAHLDHLLRRDGYDTDLITLEQVLSHRAGFHEHPAVPSYTTRLRTDPRCWRTDPHCRSCGDIDDIGDWCVAARRVARRVA